jgi:hypothetical protein
MANRFRVLSVSDPERLVLEQQVRATGSPARQVDRARIVLLSRSACPLRRSESGRLFGTASTPSSSRTTTRPTWTGFSGGASPTPSSSIACWPGMKP